MLRPLLTGLAALLLGTGLARAQTTPGTAGPPLTPAERASIEAITRAMQSKAYAGAQDPQAQADVARLSRRVDDIANQQMAGEREKVLRFLGIDPNGTNSLYIFVSWSMPIEMLRAYAVEAMWTGGALVFRGVPPKRTLVDFIRKDLHQIVYDKGASSVISLDPRLYDGYGVTSVPTIVLTTDRNNPLCSGSGEHTVTAQNGQKASYQLCPLIDPSKYWKIRGAITVDYALEAFQAAGAKPAAPFLAALRRGYRDGQVPHREQAPFTGDWKTVESPHERMLRDKPGQPPSGP